jgi:hypothetical protein
VEDITYRTDLALGAFLRFLDEQIGPGNWTFALTADHGVAPVVEYAKQFRLPAKRNPLGDKKTIKDTLEALLRKHLGLPTGGKPIVQKVEDNQIYLQHGHEAFEGSTARSELAQALVRDWLLEQPDVAAARTRTELAVGGTGRLNEMFQRAWHPRRSGDVLFVLAPYCLSGSKGTTHGSPWHYDTHVPLLLLGAGIAPGEHARRVSPAALASTVADLVGVDYPSANSEQPLTEALRGRRSDRPRGGEALPPAGSAGPGR